jgi:protein TonB
MYAAPSPGSRAATLVAILGFHAVALAAAWSLGIARVTIEPAPMWVRMVSAPSKPVEAARAVAPPHLRTPELRVAFPVVEIASQPLRSEAATPPERLPTIAVAPPEAKTAPRPAPPIEPPRFDMAYLDNPPPAYPALSRRTREEGRVLLRVRVDAEGHVAAIEVQATSGHPRLDEAAVEAVRQWRFVPARAGDHRVAGWAVVPINFHLSG